MDFRARLIKGLGLALMLTLVGTAFAQLTLEQQATRDKGLEL